MCVLEWHTFRYNETNNFLVIEIKVPKEMMRFCPSCRKHTLQSTEQAKTAGRRAGSALKKGTRRKAANLHNGYGGSPYPKMEHGVKFGAKTSHKIMLRFKCKECGKKNQKKIAQRSKKFEILK